MFLSEYEIDGKIKIDNFKSNLSIFITPWSIAHFVTGYMAQAFGINYIVGLTGHTIYEYVNYVSIKLINKWSTEWKGFKCDSIFNSFGDTLCFMIGMFLSKNYNNNYLFIFIFILGFIFFSPYFQSYLVRKRLEYIKSKDNQINIESRLFNPDTYYKNYLWIVASLIIFIKLNIKYKKYLIKK